MSQAAVDFPSPFTPPNSQSKQHQQQQQSSSSHYSNPSPHISFDFQKLSLNNLPGSSPHEVSETACRSNGATSSKLRPDLSSPFVSQMSSGKHTISSASGRSKPRLVKRRPLRSHIGKFPSVVTDNDLSSNLHQSVAGDSTDIKSTALPDSDRLEKFNHTRHFLFSANKPFSYVNSNDDNSLLQSSAGSSNEDSVIGDTKRELHSVLKPKATDFFHEEGKSTGSKFGISTNVGFVFGVNNNISTTNRISGRGQSCRAPPHLSHDASGKWNELGIKFGDNKSSLVTEKTTEAKASSKSAGWLDGKENEFKKFAYGDNSFLVNRNFCRPSENTESGQDRDGARNSGTSEFDFEDGRKNEVDTEPGLLKEKTNNVFVSVNSVNTTKLSMRSTTCKLMKRLTEFNIDGCERVGLGNNKNPCVDSSSSSSPVFIFGSNRTFTGSCAGTPIPTSSYPIKNAYLRPENDSVENTDGTTHGIIDENMSAFSVVNDDAFRNGRNAQHLMSDNKNEEKRSGLGTSDEQINMGHCPKGSFVEKQPSVINERSSNDPSLDSTTPKLSDFHASQSKDSDELGVRHRDGPNLNKTSNPPIFSTTGTDFEIPSTGGVENKGIFSFTSTLAGGRATTLDFGTSEADASSSFTFNTYSGVSKKMEFSKRSSTRGKKWKKAGGKLRQQNPVSKQSGQIPLSKEGSQNDDSVGCYSPMDFSPNQDRNYVPLNMNTTCSTSAEINDLKADRVADLSKRDMEYKENNEEVIEIDCGRFVTAVGTESSYHECERRGTNSDASSAGDAVRSNINKGEGQDGNQFHFPSGPKDSTDINVSLSLSPAHGSSSTKNRPNPKKYRMRVGRSPSYSRTGEVESLSSPVQISSHGSSNLHLNQSHGKDRGISNYEKMRKDKSKTNQGYEWKGATPTNHESCEKWRIRGNQAYKKGYMSKAEEFYTKGINSVPQSEVSGCTELLVLCYSNRAAALMSTGRMREALEDCKIAAALDPKFEKVQIRAGNCHLALGETEEAVQCFRNCLESRSGICLDRRITIEAANGLQKAQNVVECINDCSVLLEERTSDAAIRALELISAVLPFSSYSEKLLAMKGETLFMLQRYEDVIQFCEQSLVCAEKHFCMVDDNNNSVSNTSLKLWRWHLMAKSYFCLGKLEVALDLLDKEELLRAAKPRSNIQKPSISFQITVRELLRHKRAGNEAFRSGRYTEAVDNYTAALSSSMESLPFAAVCFCNRAAAHQAAGQIVDAIADCSSAIAFDGSYSKALSRRATLYETVRDYGQAASDLQRLISLLENVTQEKIRQSGTPDGQTCSNVKELRQARIRLLSVEKKTKKEISLNHYLILGIESSDTASEIKKAYRKAALRHHPDKAGQSLARSESGDDGRLWKEIAEEVQKDADRLFKMIGEAYAVLSDPTKRSKYDLQEELRNTQKDRKASGSGPSDFHNSPYESRGSRRYWQQEFRRTYWD